MIKIKVLGHDFDYKGKVEITIDNTFVHVSASYCMQYSNTEEYSWDYKVDDIFLANQVESIKGLPNDQ